MAVNIHYKIICEVYVRGEIKDIARSVSSFIKANEKLLKLNVDTFYIYSSKQEYKLFSQILSLYKSFYPELCVVNKDGKKEISRKSNYVMIFNWGEDIIMYDSKYNKFEWSDTSIDLMD